MTELSIAASVTGVIGLTGSISVTLYGFFQSIADAPVSVQAALTVVNEMSMVLNSVQRLLDGLTNVPGQRRQMIHVRHVVMIFRDLIQSFSELEAVINSLTKVSSRGPKLTRIKWVLEEKKILKCVKRIEQQKGRLSAMLLVLLCESDSDALRYQASLQTTLETLQQRFEKMLSQFENASSVLEQGNASGKFFGDGGSTVRAPASVKHSSTTSRAWCRSFQSSAYIPDPNDIDSVISKLHPGITQPSEDSAGDFDREVLPEPAALAGGSFIERSYEPLPETNAQSLTAEGTEVNLLSRACRPVRKELLRSSRPLETTSSGRWISQVTSDGVHFRFNTLTGESLIAALPASASDEQHRRFSTTAYNTFGDPRDEIIERIGQEVMHDSLAHPDGPREAPLREFEIVLEQSCVYRRVQSMEADLSFTTSIMRPHAWDTSSHLSLEDVFSVISVVALPISPEEISSIGPDLTFTRILGRSQTLRHPAFSDKVTVEDSTDELEDVESSDELEDVNSDNDVEVLNVPYWDDIRHSGVPAWAIQIRNAREYRAQGSTASLGSRPRVLART